MLGAGALGRPRGMVWGGRREEGSGWGALLLFNTLSHLIITTSREGAATLKCEELACEPGLYWPSNLCFVHCMANCVRGCLK